MNLKEMQDVYLENEAQEAQKIVNLIFSAVGVAHDEAPAAVYDKEAGTVTFSIPQGEVSREELESALAAAAASEANASASEANAATSETSAYESATSAGSSAATANGYAQSCSDILFTTSQLKNEASSSAAAAATSASQADQSYQDTVALLADSDLVTARVKCNDVGTMYSNSLNVAAVTHDAGDGKYVVYFNEPMSNASYSVSVVTETTTSRFAFTLGYTVDKFDVVIKNASDVLTDSPFNIIVSGGK